MAEAPYEIRVVTANRLIDGEVVYLASDGWTTRIADAVLCRDEKATADALARAQAEERDCRIVSPYPIVVRTEGGDIAPVLWREVIRSRGPSVALIDGAMAHAPGHRGFRAEAASPWPSWGSPPGRKRR